MVESDPPLAGPAAACVGGLVLLTFEILAYSPSDPYFGASVPPGQQAIWFLLVGPGLGAIVTGLAALVYLRPLYRVVGGTALVPLALLGLSDGSLGGLLFGTGLTLAGGLLCAAFESRTDESAALDEAGWIGWLRRNYAVVPAVFLAVGVFAAMTAPTFGSLACHPLNNVVPLQPAVAVACAGPTVWLVLLGSAIFTAPLVFRLRAGLHALPLPA